MPYKAAVIGCGRIGSELADDPKTMGVVAHTQAYIACPSTELVAICDSDQQRLDKCGERWDVANRYLDAERLLLEVQPEIISVCTPDATHSEMVRAAVSAANTRVVFAEKPLSLEVNEARAILSLANAKNVVLAVNYSRRYAESHVYLRNLVNSGGIGELQTIGGYYTKGVKHNGTHWFDLARAFCGEVQSVWAHQWPDHFDSDPTLDVILEFQSGIRGYLQGCDETSFAIFEMDLIGTSGRIRITDYGQTVQSFKVDDSPFYSGYRTLIPDQVLPGGFKDVMLNAVEDLVSCLEDSKQPLCSASDAIQALAIATAACDAARTKQMVSPEVTTYE